MGLPAVSLSALLCAVVACGGAKSNGAIGNRSSAQHDLSAKYFCSIESDGYTYPRFPCAIRSVGDKYELAKLGGSQRFRGEVRAVGDGFSFDGEFFCPFGDCTSPMHGEFVRRPDGTLVGKFDQQSIVVTLEPGGGGDDGNGAAYGGDSYGGFGYGGASYGGATYGLQIPRRNSR
jgi:hypothetical protein